MADDPPSAPSAEPAPEARKPVRRRWIAAAVVLPIVLAAAVAGWGYWHLHAPGGAASDTTVIIPKGTGVRGTADLLDKAGVIDSRTLFLVGVRLDAADRHIKAGEYLFPAHVSMDRVIDLLREGKTVVRRFTVAEGLSVKQVVAALKAEPTLSGPIETLPPEGSLLPETYNYSYGDSRAGLLARMQKAMKDKLSDLWQARSPGLPLQSPEDAVILASIVEKETALPDERPRIAGVFVNRLEAGMPLQSDPTIVYGITGGEPLGRPIRLSELQEATPYNTYTFTGLPPTPIDNPGAASLEAVMQPLDTKDLYFVANGGGGHAFSRTYAEHVRNVQKWRSLERAGDEH
ncbi:MAG: endolytic transglycosylase MltG [Alphaproteobacteria bacterium]|nr:endolytic transglycosylase MltG [Alphaproteobacteria bacterium]